MKNASLYEKKVKKMMGSLPKVKAAGAAPDPVRVLIEAVVSADAPRRSAGSILQDYAHEYVDFNEVRVAPAKELADRMGRDFVNAREKGETLVRTLNAIFDKTGTMTMAYMSEMPKKDLRRHLAEVGLSPYSVACVMLYAFAHPALPVDASLVDALKMEEALPGDCTIEDAQAFLERILNQKDYAAAHEFFRAHVEKNAKAIAKWRKANPEQATLPAYIIPPPKFQMMAKSQPLPPMKGDADFDGGDVAVDLDDAPELDEPADIPDAGDEAPEGEQPPAPRKPKAPPAKSRPAGSGAWKRKKK